MTNSAAHARYLHRQLVGQRTGILDALYESVPAAGEPAIHAFSTHMCDVSKLGQGNASSTACGGAGFSREQAILATMGEAVERYCSQFQEAEDLLFASYLDAPGLAVAPATWALFSDVQHNYPRFPFQRPGPDTQLQWTRATTLATGQTTFVPACMVYMPYRRDPNEPPITPSITTGLSCADSFEEAALKGIFEVVERDALSLVWLKRVPTWELTGIPEDLLAFFNADQIEYHVYDLTSDVGIPVYLVLSIGDSSEGKLVAIGAAASIDPQIALRKAFVENAQGRPWLVSMKQAEPDWEPEDDFSNVQSFHDHGRVLTICPELLEDLGFLGARGTTPFRTGPSLTPDRIETVLSEVVADFARRGLDVLTSDLTTPDIRDLGLHVARVLIPGMQPLHGNHCLPFLGGARIQDAAGIFSVSRDRVLPANQFNPIPHPLP